MANGDLSEEEALELALQQSLELEQQQAAWTAMLGGPHTHAHQVEAFGGTGDPSATATTNQETYQEESYEEALERAMKESLEIEKAQNSTTVQPHRERTTERRSSERRGPAQTTQDSTTATIWAPMPLQDDENEDEAFMLAMEQSHELETRRRHLTRSHACITPAPPPTQRSTTAPKPPPAAGTTGGVDLYDDCDEDEAFMLAMQQYNELDKREPEPAQLHSASPSLLPPSNPNPNPNTASSRHTATASTYTPLSTCTSTSTGAVRAAAGLVGGSHTTAATPPAPPRGGARTEKRNKKAARWGSQMNSMIESVLERNRATFEEHGDGTAEDTTHDSSAGPGIRGHFPREYTQEQRQVLRELQRIFPDLSEELLETFLDSHAWSVEAVANSLLTGGSMPEPAELLDQGPWTSSVHSTAGWSSPVTASASTPTTQGLTSAQELSLRHLQLTLVAIDPQIVSQTFIETNFDVDRTQEQLMIYHWDDFMLSLEAGMAADAEWDDEGPFGTSLEDPAPVLPVNANARRTDSRGSARRAEKATATASSLRSGSSSTEWDSVTKPSNHNELVKQAQIFRDLGVLAFKDMRATFQRAAEASSSGAPRPDLWEKGRDLQRRHKNLQWQAAHVYLRAHNDPRHVAFEFAPSPAKGKDPSITVLPVHGKDPLVLDVHHLFVDQAVCILNQIMDYARSVHNVSRIVLITGRGNHSQGGRAKILPKFSLILGNSDVPFEAVPHQGKVVIFPQRQ